MMRFKVMAAIIGAIGLVIVLSVFKPISSIPQELLCYSDSDCVPAETCHPTSCVNEQYKEETGEVFCTADCVSGTLDCGQGQCECINNQCEAVFNEAN